MMPISDGAYNKAQKLIGDYCKASYEQVNYLKNGRLRKRHVPYSIPEIALALIAALNHDDDYELKRLFLIESTRSFSLI
jgi:hypothetical protein